jgi:hypothetical protein
MTTLEITQDDIARGKPGDTHSCPVVLAATKAFHCSSQEISVVGFQLIHMPSIAASKSIRTLSTSCLPSTKEKRNEHPFMGRLMESRRDRGPIAREGTTESW